MAQDMAELGCKAMPTDHDHVYDVTVSNGETHRVKTPHHHDDHDRDAWTNHLVDMLKNVVAGLAVHHLKDIRYIGKIPRK